MRFDFSYVELVYEIIDENKNINELINTRAFQLIKSHGESTFGGHNNIVKAIKSIKNRCPNKLANHLLNNKEKIFSLIKIVKERELEFNNIIVENVKNIYMNGNFEDINIFFILGYDAIGYKGNIICSMDLEFILEDYRELISILIHELAHIIHSQYCPKMNNISIEKESIKDTLNLLIQSEGIAIFSAYFYRNLVGIFNNKEGSIRQDYINTVEKEIFLREVYKNTMVAIKEDKDIYTILDIYFSARVDHALGFIIFENIYKKLGLDAIREMATINNKEFVRLYL